MKFNPYEIKVTEEGKCINRPAFDQHTGGHELQESICVRRTLMLEISGVYL